MLRENCPRRDASSLPPQPPPGRHSWGRNPRDFVCAHHTPQNNPSLSAFFFPPGWQVTRVSPYVRGPFPSKEIRRISERDDPSPPVVPGGLWIPNPRKSGSVIGADRQRLCPSCVLLKRVPQGRTESGGLVLVVNSGPFKNFFPCNHIINK